MRQTFGWETLRASLQRLSPLVTYSSLVAIGSGRGDDAPFFERFWPGSHALLIDLAVEMKNLQTADAINRDTTLLIAPWCLTEFLDFNAFLLHSSSVPGQSR